MDNSSIVALYFARSERAIQETDRSRLYPRKGRPKAGIPVTRLLVGETWATTEEFPL